MHGCGPPTARVSTVRLVSLTAALKERQADVTPIEKALRAAAAWNEPADILVEPPRSYRSRDFAIAGRAFDYWLRAYFAVQHGLNETDTVNELLLRSLHEPDDAYPRLQGDDGVERTFREALKVTISTRAAGIQAHAIETDDFFENCLDQSVMEAIYRRGDLDELSCPIPATIADLRGLANLAKERAHLFAGNMFDLNPQFAHPTFAADGDFAIDDLLVDIKTTKAQIVPMAFAQTACYTLISGWNTRTMGPYRRIGVYSSRYGAMGIVQLATVLPLLRELRTLLESIPMPPR